MKILLACFLACMAVGVHSEILTPAPLQRPKYNITFDVDILNTLVLECGPETILNVCPCRQNELFWTYCLDRKTCHLPEKPDVGQCMSLATLDVLLSLYKNDGRTRCYTEDFPGTEICSCQCRENRHITRP